MKVLRRCIASRVYKTHKKMLPMSQTPMDVHTKIPSPHSKSYKPMHISQIPKTHILPFNSANMHMRVLAPKK
jgi:hypothetical protein